MAPYLDVRLWDTIWPLPVMALLVSAGLSLLGRRKGQPQAWFVTFVGAVAIYLIGRESGDTRMLVSLCVFSSALTLWIGAMWGTSLRENFIEYVRSEAYLRRQADVERSVRTYRESLGLPADFKVREYD